MTASKSDLQTWISNSTSALTDGLVIGVVFDCEREGEETWVAVCRIVPSISAAPLLEATSVVRRVIAELVAKGDHAWAQFKEAGP